MTGTALMLSAVAKNSTDVVRSAPAHSVAGTSRPTPAPRANGIATLSTLTLIAEPRRARSAAGSR